MDRRVPPGMIHYIRELAGLWRGDPRTDGELLAAFVDAGDEAAFTALVIRHGRAVWNTCRRVLANDADAEDAFQATFIALARKAGRLRREALDGWLHRVAQQAALDVAKIARRRIQAHSRLYERAVPDTANTRAAEEELRDAVREEMARLPEKLRAPLALYYLDGKTQAEVGVLLGISDRAVANRLERALELLRQRLAQRGLAVATAVLVALVGEVPAATAMPTGLMAAAALRIHGGPRRDFGIAFNPDAQRSALTEDRAVKPKTPVVAWSGDHATACDRRSPLPSRRGDLRSSLVAWSGDHATTCGPAQ